MDKEKLIKSFFQRIRTVESPAAETHVIYSPPLITQFFTQSLRSLSCLAREMVEMYRTWVEASVHIDSPTIKTLQGLFVSLVT